MTDDGMMEPDQQLDPMTILLAKVEDLEKRLKTITDDNAAIRQQNATLLKTNVNLMQQSTPALPENVPDVRDIAFESLKKELMRGRQ